MDKLEINFNGKNFEEKLSKIDKNGVIFHSNEYKEKRRKKKIDSKLYFHMYKDYEHHYIEETDYNYNNLTYIPEKRFDYFILIDKKIYKKLKDFIKIKILWVNEGDIEYNEYSLNDICKFTKLHKKKKIIHEKIQIKLRAFNNTFIPLLRIKILKEKLYEFVKDQTQLFDVFSILQKPVTKTYQNHIELFTKFGYEKWNYKRDKISYVMEEFPMKNNLTVQLINFRIHKKYNNNFIDLIFKNEEYYNYNGMKRVAVFKIYDEDDKKEKKTIYFKITFYD